MQDAFYYSPGLLDMVLHPGFPLSDSTGPLAAICPQACCPNPAVSHVRELQRRLAVVSAEPAPNGSKRTQTTTLADSGRATVPQSTAGLQRECDGAGSEHERNGAVVV
uniref:Uncharacterized protein n=1 Tax=Mycena chlorophos TaxID=658473 RepID=A0ABQ0LNV3_MYCCL|nr:predicted protein [Mycena chlorophos]